MADKLTEVAKRLGKTRRNSEAALRRYAPKHPKVERVRDIFDSVIPFEMEFDTESQDSTMALDLYFNKPPPLRVCDSIPCESFTTGPGDQLLQVSAKQYDAGTLTVFRDNVQITSFDEYDPFNGYVFVSGTSNPVQVFTICYCYCTNVEIIDDFIREETEGWGTSSNINYGDWITTSTAAPAGSLPEGTLSVYGGHATSSIEILLSAAGGGSATKSLTNRAVLILPNSFDPDEYVVSFDLNFSHTSEYPFSDPVEDLTAGNTTIIFIRIPFNSVGTGPTFTGETNIVFNMGSNDNAFGLPDDVPIGTHPTIGEPYFWGVITASETASIGTIYLDKNLYVYREYTPNPLSLPTVTASMAFHCEINRSATRGTTIIKVGIYQVEMPISTLPTSTNPSVFYISHSRGTNQIFSSSKMWKSDFQISNLKFCSQVC